MRLHSRLAFLPFIAIIVSSCSASRMLKTPPQVWTATSYQVLTDAYKQKKQADALCMPTSDFAQKKQGYELAMSAWTAVRAVGTPARELGVLVSKCAGLYADWITDAELLKDVTLKGVAAAEESGANNGDPLACYYMAFNKGIYINNIGIKAIGKAGAVVDILKVAARLPDTDQGGPLRVLGILYLRAPAWPLGPGDQDEAMHWLKLAVEKYPSHPQNHMFFAEVLLSDGQKQKAVAELEAASKLIASGDWGDYSKRWQAEVDELMKRAKK
jgi:hypothetical protein